MRKKLAMLLIFISPAVFANENETRSLTFAQAANLAVESSADLRHSRASLALLEKTWSWGARAYFPQLNISISENDRLQQIGADSFIKNYGLSLEQMVWDGGRTSMSRKIERMELDLSIKKLDRMADEIAESAIAAYRRVLSSRAILGIKKDALSILEEQRKILNEEVALGFALPVDLASADISIADAKIDLFSLELDLKEIEKQFLEILGIEYIPALTEKINIYQSAVFYSGKSILPAASAAAALAKEQNPDLIEARYSITKKQMELKFISISWIPSLRLTGNFALTGQHYPLTRYNWSVGVSIDFSSPWLQNRFAAQTGWEPSSLGKYDRTAIVQTSITPLPDPASMYSKDQAKLALSLEQEKYQTIYERIGRTAAIALEKCGFMEQKRLLALEAAALGAERCKVEEIRLNLGHITRLKLMEIYTEQTQKEIAAVEAAIALLEAERELERFLDLKPGELINFANSINSESQTRRN
ncbi:MAG: TolC family protein [Treponema sp.]|nr:TolC family protein [Treponema sp.]